MIKIKRAIVSVTDKTGVVEFCKELSKLNIEILSTGGTAKTLRDAGITVVDVSQFTGSPEILDGRLKTLHPKIEGGILGIRSNPQHQHEMASHDILPIDLVVVNLYAFEQTISKPGCTLEHAIENIDIGGPTMLRAAAKNYQDVTVIVDVDDYKRVALELEKNKGTISRQTNFELAIKVFQITAAYDSAISAYLTPKLKDDSQDYPKALTLQLKKVQDLRYGENPHQTAAAYCDVNQPSGSILKAKQLHGKELSFNNFIDLDAAYQAVREFKNEPAAVIIKHTNPCGAALGLTLQEAFKRAKQTDPTSAFGGIIGLNQKVDVDTANEIGETFFECIIAPDYDDEAFKILAAKKNIRLMSHPDFFGDNSLLDLKRISGGLLVQQKDNGMVDLSQCEVPTKRKPTNAELEELSFAWKIAKHVKSNAIVYTNFKQVIGVGAGQMSRIDSAQIAKSKALYPLKGCVMASDAFFPFRDGLDTAGQMGIKAVVQPGGSVRDDEVIQAANEHGIAMVFTKMRHFKH